MRQRLALSSGSAVLLDGLIAGGFLHKALVKFRLLPMREGFRKPGQCPDKDCEEDEPDILRPDVM